MKILGIIAEYNPFHNGHMYHMEAAKATVEPDVTVIAMSGDFTQRGEMAAADKWLRSRNAVRCGADLVFELPFVFACNTAPLFAQGGVDLLVNAGATHISFGCEDRYPQRLQKLAAELTGKSADIRNARDAYMKDGYSNAKAYESAVRDLLGEEAADLILEPNNILAIEYLKRIAFWQERGCDIEAVPVSRVGSGYKDVNLSEGYAGASNIRELAGLSGAGRPAGDVESLCSMIGKLVPEQTAEWLCDRENFADNAAEYAAALDRYYQVIKSILVRSAPEELSEIYRIGEGIENRFISNVVKCNDYVSFCKSIVSKRYTLAAVRRMIAYIAMGLDGECADRITSGSVRYLRVLAAGDKGRNHIRYLKNNADMPVITSINRQMPADPLALESLEVDMRAADLYNTFFGRRLYDYSDKVVRPYIES